MNIQISPASLLVCIAKKENSSVRSLGSRQSFASSKNSDCSASVNFANFILVSSHPASQPRHHVPARLRDSPRSETGRLGVQDSVCGLLDFWTVGLLSPRKETRDQKTRSPRNHTYTFGLLSAHNPSLADTDINGSGWAAGNSGVSAIQKPERCALRSTW